jgi:hypothetical protein
MGCRAVSDTEDGTGRQIPSASDGYAVAVEPIALAAAAIKVSLFLEALLFGLTASRSMTHAVRVHREDAPVAAAAVRGRGSSGPFFCCRAAQRPSWATNERLRCSDGEERFLTIEPPYGDDGFPCCRDARRCRTNSDTCRNKTATAPPRDKAINSISISMNESD